MHHHVLEALENVNRMRRVGFGLSWVLADHIQSAHFLALHCFEHLGEVLAVVRLNGAVPGRAKLVAHLGVENVLEARHLVGDGAHVAATLHVVLAAKRLDAGAVAADLTA